jgi:hypothetical protein
MLRRSPITRLSFWEMPITEQMNFTRFWKNGGDGDRAAFAKELPRTVHGYYEYHHPRTDDVCRYYPYRGDLIVNGSSRPTFTQMLENHYVPPMLNDEERVQYVAGKTGRSERDVAKELFRMRRLRAAVAQSFRDKLSGNWIRQPPGDWSVSERKYFETSLNAASMFGMDFFQTHSYDPYIIYSPYYQVGDCCDGILNKTIRTRQQYCFVEICLHHSVPRARLPGVIGKCKEPLQEFEPSVQDMIHMKLEMCAFLAKKDQYVTEHAYDPGHQYLGAIVHFFRGTDLDEILFEITPLELKLERAEKVLRHYYSTYVAPEGGSNDGVVGVA